MSATGNRHDKIMRAHGHEWSEVPRQAVGPCLPPKKHICLRCGQEYVRNRRGRGLQKTVPCNEKIVQDVMEA